MAKLTSRLLGMLAEGGMTTDATFEEDQGITPDDDECKQLEAGEFCRTAQVRRNIPAKSGGTAKTAAGGVGSTVKRAASAGQHPSQTQESQETPKKKKAKKA
jgi:hypothetical protein